MKLQPEAEASHFENALCISMLCKVMIVHVSCTCIGELVKLLIVSTVTKYLEFKSVESSYVFYKNKLHKIPATDQEALRTGKNFPCA